MSVILTSGVSLRVIGGDTPATTAPVFLAFDAINALASSWVSVAGTAHPVKLVHQGGGALSVGTDATINDEPYIETDGTAYLLSDNNLNLSHTSKLEYFVITYAPRQMSVAHMILSDNRTSQPRWHIRIDDRDALVLHEGSTGLSRRRTTAIISEAWHVWNGRHDFALSTKEANLYIDGSEVGTTQDDNDNASGTVFSNSPLEVYALQGANLADTGTRLAYILMYDSVLSSEDRVIVTNWINNRWGL